MTDQPASASVLEAAIESELTASEDEIVALVDIAMERAKAAEAKPEKRASSRMPHSLAERRRGSVSAMADATLAALTDEERASLKLLQARTSRLRQVQKLFKDDPELIRIVDETIGNQVKATEQRQQALVRAAQQRQTIFSVVFSVLSLIAGWLLSAVSPVSAVAHLVGH